MASEVLTGKTAIITGSGQGIGSEFARSFAEAGAQVVVADLNEANAKNVATELCDGGGVALGVGVDVTDEGAVQSMMEAAVGEFGRIDVLVNGAAVFSSLIMRPFEEIDSAEWRTVMDVNVTGVFLCCQAVAPVMRRQQAGRIINISSATVLGGRPNYLHYVTSKAALVGMTRSLARELGSSGVTVNAIMPGSVETGIPRDSARPEAVEKTIASQSIPRRITSADICGSAVFLASDASRMITGQTVVVDGGTEFV
ncbi:SDR family oxidoreductase [Pseudonocardia kujensis]|uniref:SDR family NAD(P)-dependent oxidoreductase n=1 Tax=Pseudonocardia kujensis TaxID=1128675 RepID=UPI001E490EF7|nr:SDR family oxidoreductase [Pseudonocardia kujensis]MCE0762026.1 SDR family oxidoreductase [Pseudonocardia kujensis]